MKRCYRCGKNGHVVSECEHKNVICFNYREEGHIGSQCLKPKRAQLSGKVFALVDSCKIYKEDNNARYKIINEKRGKHQQNHGKPYDAPAGKGK